MSVNAPTFTVRPPARSMGLKLLLVCALALLMTIPALFVLGLLSERRNSAEKVVTEISELVGGPQSFMGPVLAVPYSLPPAPLVAGQPPSRPETGVYIIFPKTGEGVADLKTGVKRRGLFKAVTWTSRLGLTSHFDLTNAGSQAPANATLDWSRAEFLVGASDARGAQADVVLTAGEGAAQMTPASAIDSVELASGGGDAQAPGRNFGPSSIKFFGASATALAKPGAKFDVRADLNFAGAQRIALYAFAETTTFHATGDWPDPSYDGGFLPISHNEAGDKDGAESKDKAKTGRFRADWAVPYIARGVAGEGSSEVLTRLGYTSLGVSLVEKANPYQAVSRSLKYAVMFVGLVFLAYFMFETVQKKRVHPAQYVLIGLAQIIFYLLLLSIAERVGFDLGFLIAAAATVSLISAYAGWVFKSRKQGYVALASFTALYALIYILMRLEDWALLVGAVTSFGAIAAVMYFTRNLDWYGTDAAKGPAVELKEGA